MAVSKRVINDLLLGAALTLSLFLAGVTLPILGLAVGLLTPVPIAYYFRKVGRGYGALMLGAVVVLVASVAGREVAVFFIAEFAAMGIALSESVRMKLSIGKGSLLPAMVSLAGSAVLLLTLSSNVDKPLTEMIEEQINRNVKETVELYKKSGLSDEQVEGLIGFSGKIEALILKTFPSLLFVSTLFVSLLNLLILKRLLKKRGIEEYQVELANWRSPEFLVWVLIAGGGLLLLKDERAATVGLNLLIVTGCLYLFQGLAITAFYFKKMETPLFLRVLGYLLIFFQQIFTILVIGLGLFDLWFDFRRLKKGGTDADNIDR